MKKIFAVLLASMLFAPVFAFADSTYGVEPTLGQLLTRIAALEAIISNSPINCAVTATKTTVHVGESFVMAWGSYGADPSYSTDPKNAYPINGEQAMKIDTAQSRIYKFTFFGPNGAQKECDQTITVLP